MEGLPLIRRSVSPRKKLCPRCFKELKIVSSFSGWLLPEEYVCESCGYAGYVSLELKKESGGEEES